MRPDEIDLHLELDPTKRLFRGEVETTLLLAKRVRLIELHAAELEISHAVLESTEENGDAGDRLRATVELHPECETVVLRFDRLVPAGRARLRLRFKGRVRDDLRGLYRSRDRKAPWLATQLCPTDARRLFPCFDEPGIKARLRLSVTTPAEHTVIANSPIERAERVDARRQRIHFERTPPLSAYLFAIAVGPFALSRAIRVSGTAIRIATLPGHQRLGRFARHAAAASLERLEEWFDLAHPYPKLDLVALPDFAFGAMENAGAVFFRDSVLLLDERQASHEERMRAAETIAHEISHMWFGNWVTMAWWNDLWLNESFATWMAYVVLDDWQPEWQVWLEFVRRRETALELDALATSHPIAPPIRSAEEAHENFDAITYTKGACVLRMMERFLGPEPFQRGVRRYVKRHAEGSATAEDLWTALSEETSVEVAPLLDDWTRRTGFPRLSIEREATGRLSASQDRFVSLAPSSRRSRASETWSIPWIGRSIAGDSGAHPRQRARSSAEHRALISESRNRLEWPDERETLYGNANEAGFYRIDHGPAGARHVVESISKLAAEERIGFLGHEWALARAGLASVDRPLDALEALADEENPDVLATIESILAQLTNRPIGRDGERIRDRMRSWIAQNHGPRLEELGVRDRRGESEARARVRARLISIVGGLGGRERVAHVCREIAWSYLQGDRRLSPNSAAEVLVVAATVADRRFQTALIRAVRSAATPQARRRALFALGGCARAALFDRTFDAALDARLAPAVDRAGLLIALLSTGATAQLAWKRLPDAWPRLEQELPPIQLARIAAQTPRALAPERAGDVAAFFERHPLEAGARTLRQILEEFAVAERFGQRAETDLAARFLE